MRRPLIVLGLLGACMCWHDVAAAQEACVRAPNGAIVCGPIVTPRFELSEPPRPEQPVRPPGEGRRDQDARPNERRDDRDTRPAYQERRDEDERRYDDRQDGDRRPAEMQCPRNYVMQDGRCRPYTRR